MPDWGQSKTDSVQNSYSAHSVKAENVNELLSFSFLFDAQLVHPVKTVVYIVSWQVTILVSKDVAAKIHTGYRSHVSPAYYEFFDRF